MKKEIVRIHDKIYLKENRYKKTKDSFKYFFNILKKKTNKNKKYSLVDIGCANGELLYNIEKKFKNLSLTGVDIHQNLLDKAKKHCSNKVLFLKKDISKKNQRIGKYDIIILSGVLSIFDNPKIVLKNLLMNLKKNGQIYIYGLFNPYPSNVYVKYEDLSLNKKVLQSGWNMFSIKFIKTFFKNKKVELFPFFMKRKIKQNKKDLFRSWTIKLSGKNYCINALGIIQNLYWIRIK